MVMTSKEMVNRNYYIAILHKEDGGYWVSFVDFPECFSQGELLNEAFNMSVEALELCIEDRIVNNEDTPLPSLPSLPAIECSSNEKMIIVPYSIKEKKVA